METTTKRTGRSRPTTSAVEKKANPKPHPRTAKGVTGKALSRTSAVLREDLAPEIAAVNDGNQTVVAKKISRTPLQFVEGATHGPRTHGPRTHGPGTHGPGRYRAALPEGVKDGTLHLRLKEGLKDDATAVLAKIGISVPEAIRVFLQRIVSEGRFPFELEVPNAVTRRAMDEADRMTTARFRNAKELFDDLEKGGAT